MENLKCPICNKKIDVILVPYGDGVKKDCEVICENEYYVHGIALNGVDILFRSRKDMVSELTRRHLRFYA